MKILKIKVSGYKLLEDDFEINFLNKARVNANDKQDEIIELAENLYIHTTTVFTGKNASGKTSLISLLSFVNQIILSGRVSFDPFLFRNDQINLELLIEFNTYLFKYTTKINKPNKSLLKDVAYCNFSEQKLYKQPYYKSYGKNVLNLEFNEIISENDSVDDTSILKNLFEGTIALFGFHFLGQ